MSDHHSSFSHEIVDQNNEIKINIEKLKNFQCPGTELNSIINSAHSVKFVNTIRKCTIDFKIEQIKSKIIFEWTDYKEFMLINDFIMHLRKESQKKDIINAYRKAKLQRQVCFHPK